MKKTVIIFILSLLAWNVVAQERDYAADARRAFEEGRYADAVKLYDAAYVFDGKDYSHEKETASQCLTKMLEAIAAVNVNQVEDAVAAYKFVLSKNPKDSVASEYVRMHEYLNYINGHEYVDLGLPSGLKWATCNVGASSPEESGDYYAWGETGTKTSYDKDNSVTNGKKLSKLRNAGIIDGSDRLTLSYDAARANWGGSWRMPTKTEYEELKDKCTWTWITQNGVTGYEVTGPNGRSIFLPAGGGRIGASLHSAGHFGFYWSSTAGNGSRGSYYLLFDSGGRRMLYWYDRNRYSGNTVRAVSE